MVLDVKAMEWAGQRGIDTAKLKAAKVRVFGKWYYPVIPAGLKVVNLQTGQAVSYPQDMVAGEVLFAAEEDLRRAGLYP